MTDHPTPGNLLCLLSWAFAGRKKGPCIPSSSLPLRHSEHVRTGSRAGFIEQVKAAKAPRAQPIIIVLALFLGPLCSPVYVYIYFIFHIHRDRRATRSAGRGKRGDGAWHSLTVLLLLMLNVRRLLFPPEGVSAVPGAAQFTPGAARSENPWVVMNEMKW